MYRTGPSARSHRARPGPAIGAPRPSRRRILIADRVELTARARDFLRASIRRDRRRRTRAVTVLSALLVVAVGLATVAFDRQRAAEDQQRVAEERQQLATARQLLAQAETRLDQDPRTALRLNEAAVHLQDSPETRSALVNNLLTTPYSGTLTGHDGGVGALTFAPDGSLLASAGTDGTVRLWNTADPAAPTPLSTPLTGHDGSVGAVAFTPDGNTLASAGLDRTVRLWNTTDPAAPTPLGGPLPAHDAGVGAVAFPPHGNTLASAGRFDGIVRLWNLTGLIELRDHVMERACALTGGALSQGEWRAYVPDLKYVDVCRNVTRPR